MDQFKANLYRYRWLLFGCSSIVILSIISLIAIDIFFVENYFGIGVSQNQTPSTSASPQLKEIVPATPIQRSLQVTIPPTETSIEASHSRQLAYVQRVLDGDTIEVILDGKEYQLRYIGIDAPEFGMPNSNLATEANKELVENQIVELERDKSDKDQFGRLLRYVYLPDGRLVNSELVGLGLATAFAYPPDTLHQDLIESRQLAAQDAGIGIWAPQLSPTDEIEITAEINVQVKDGCSQFNAPGNDNENKNEEFVCLINLNQESVEMRGWSIHDEYGWTYHFPSFNLAGNATVRIFTGCGLDAEDELYWCKDETAIWNNDGDCVYILDPDGLEKYKYCY